MPCFPVAVFLVTPPNFTMWVWLQVCEDSKWHEEMSVPQAGIEHLVQSNSFLMSSPPYAALIKCLGFSIN